MLEVSNLLGVIIFKEDGRLLFSHLFEPQLNFQMVSDLLAATSFFSNEISGGSLEGLLLGGKYYLFAERLDDILYTVILNENRSPDNLLLVISRRFYKNYYRILNDWRGEITVFNGFKSVLDNILQIDPNRETELVPINNLDSFSLVEFDKGLHPLLKYLIKNRKSTVTISVLKSSLKMEDSLIEEGIVQLKQREYLGVRISGNEEHYFI